MNSIDHVAGLDAGLRRGAARHDLDDECARARLEAEVREIIARHRLHLHADAPAHDLARSQLRQQLADRVDRHGEADADVAALPPRSLLMIAVLMPITSPRTLSSGPPELPGLIAASVWIISLVRPLVLNGRPMALITPTVTVWA